MKVAVLYASYIHYDSTEYFFKNAYENNPDVDYYLIDSNNTLESHTKLNNILKNIKTNSNVKHIRRNNFGLDFAAWSDVLLKYDVLYSYDYYIFINDTCTGPFLPIGVKIDWVNLFISKITDDVKLFGPVINYEKNGVNPHVQTFMFVTDNIGLKIAIENDIFSTKIAETYKNTDFSNIKNKLDYVVEYEIRLSSHILDDGYNISCQQACLQGIDFRLQRYMNHIKRSDGFLCEHAVYFANRYFGTDLSPFELIFSKMKTSHLGFISETILKNLNEKYFLGKFEVKLISELSNIDMKLPENDWIELDKETYIVYGSAYNSKYIDVEDKIKIENGIYEIPSSKNFNEIFTDPIPMTTKALYIKINNNRYIVPERATENIKLLD